MKKPNISLPMSLVFAKEKGLQVLFDFFFHMNVTSSTSGVVEEAENSDQKESSDGVV